MIMRSFALLLLLLTVLPAQADTPLRTDAGHHALAGHLALAVDKKRELTIESVAGANFNDLKGDLNLGFTRSVAWLRFTLVRPADMPAAWWLEVAPPWLSKVTLFVPRSGGGFEARETGNTFPFSQRQLAYRQPVFFLDLPVEHPQTYYLRIESTGPALLCIVKLWQPQAFAIEAANNQLAWGCYAGLVIAMILASLWFWWVTQDYEYLLLAFAALFTLLLRLLAEGGILQQFLLADRPSLREPLAGIFLALAFGTATNFINRFSRLDEYLPRFERFFSRGAWFISALACLGFCFDRYVETMPYLQISVLLGIVLNGCLTLWLVKRGQQQAATLMIAFIFIWIAVPIRFAKTLGWIEPNLDGDLLMHLSQIAYLGILTFAGHQRYRSLRLANEKSQELVEAMKHLEQASTLERATHQAHRQFVTTISHELRNPLAIIDAATQNLTHLHNQDFDEKARMRLEKIQAATNRLTLIIDECLTPEHVDVEPAMNLRKTIRVRDLLIDAANTAQLSSSRHEVQIECDPELSIICNPQLLKLALRTLTDNAVKYTPEGTTVRLCATIDPQWLSIEVADNGPGINANDLPHIFEKFFRGRNATQTPGTGLGLALAQQVFESHGGELQVANVPGQGVTFTGLVSRS